MSREEIQKLLGGYATGTLTPEEQQVLFDAALDDQELFDALAREQSLRDLLRDPAAKAQVLAALDERSVPWYRRFGWWQPAALAAAAAIVLVGVTMKRQTAQVVTVAQMAPQPPAAPGAALDRREAAPSAEPAQAPAAPSPERKKVKRAEPAPTPPPPSAPEPAATVAALRDAVIDKKAEEKDANSPAPPPAPKPLDQVRADTQVQVQSEASTPLSLANGFRGAGRGGRAGGGGGGGSMAPLELAAARPSARALFYGNSTLPPVPAQQAATRQAGSVTQATQQAPQAQQGGQQQQGQQGMAGGAVGNVILGRVVAKTAAPASPNPAIRYRILRGANVVGEKELRAGDTLQLELMPNSDGVLTVIKSGRQIFTQTVTAMTTYTLPLPSEEGALDIMLTRVGVIAAPSFGVGGGSPATHEVAADGTYVAGQLSAPILRFSIPLSFQ